MLLSHKSSLPFNLPEHASKARDFVVEALESGRTGGDGPFTHRCEQWIADRLGGNVLLTSSCTAALEMTALLLNIAPGDEVILPSFTFVTSALAFRLRGARPVFVDIRPDTFNLDETKVEAAISERTRAIVAVHYNGVACEMDTLAAIARRHGVALVEDAAQAVLCTYKGRQLGAIGDISCFSFHHTKVFSGGEGGALLIRDPQVFSRARILRDKGTNRHAFVTNQVSHYNWVDLGSSFLASEFAAAALMAQLLEADDILERRRRIYECYETGLAPLFASGVLRAPVVPAECGINYHFYHVLVGSPKERSDLLSYLHRHGINACFHYVPLHTSDYAISHGWQTELPVTDRVANTLVRLPLYTDMANRQDEIIGRLLRYYGQ